MTYYIGALDNPALPGTVASTKEAAREKARLAVIAKLKETRKEGYVGPPKSDGVVDKITDTVKHNPMLAALGAALLGGGVWFYMKKRKSSKSI